MSSPFNVRVLELDAWDELRSEMERIGPNAQGVEIMLPKGLFRVVKLEEVGFAAANIIKQEMLSKGGEAVIRSDIYLGEEKASDILLMGTRRHYDRLIEKLRLQPLKSLQFLAQELEGALSAYDGRERGSLEIGGKTFVWGARTYVMGIVNLTADSFSGDGLSADVGAAVAQAQRFVAEGADIIDIGGESTRPGAQVVPLEEELRRVLPVIERLSGEIDLPISIDTYKAEVARKAIAAGAGMINDVWGLKADPKLVYVAAEHDVPVVVMHNRRTPQAAMHNAELGGRYRGVKYKDLMAEVIRELRESIQIALEAGIPREKIIVDPGIGFGKTVQQSLEALRRLAELKVLGCPILLGSSRKSLIGYTLDLPVEERLEGTAATVAIGIANGADIVRVHDVLEMVRVSRMTDALVGVLSPEFQRRG